MKRFEAIIFDLDGTLIDTLGDFEAAINGMLRQLQYAPVSREQVEQRVGKGSEHLVRSILELQAASGHTTHTLGEGYVQMAALASYMKQYRKINGKNSQVYPGAKPLLQALHAQGVPLACTTNKPVAFAKLLLAATGLDRFFQHVFGGDSFERKKPDPLPLLKTCEALGTAPENTLMVGDSSNDAQAADAAHCPVVLMRYGYNHGQDITQVNALAHLGSMEELGQWLAEKLV